jgi:WD40 repeat protein
MSIRIIVVLIMLLLSLCIAAESLAQHPTLYLETGHLALIPSVAISPNGRLLATSSFDRTIKLWDIETARELRTFAGHGNAVRSVAFSPDGTLIVSGSGDRQVRVWDVATGTCIVVLRGHKNIVATVAFSPDGQQIASGGYDRNIHLWDLKTRQLARTLGPHPGNVEAVAFSPDGQILASGGNFVRGPNRPNSVHLWDLSRKSHLTVIPIDSVIWNNTVSLHFTPNGKMLIGGGDGVFVWDAVTRQQVQKLLREPETRYTTAVNSTLLATVGSKGQVSILSLTGENKSGFPATEVGQPHGVVFDRDGKSIFVTGSSGIARCSDRKTPCQALRPDQAKPAVFD